MAVTRRALTCMAAGLPLLSSRRAAADAAPRVTVATYPGFGTRVWKSVVTDRFTQETGITAEVYESALPAASIAQAEGRPQFNAAIIAAYQTPGLAKKGLLELLTPDDIPGIRNVPERHWPLTPEGKLMGMPVYFGLFGIAYSTQLAKAADFSSWKNLLDPQWKGQLSISRPNFLAAYDVNLYAKLNGGDENNLQPGRDFLRKLVPQALNVYSSMASAEAQLGRGEVAAVPFYANEVAMMRRSGATEVALVVPDEGGLILPYVLVLPAGGRDQEAARRLINAIAEPQYQAGLAQSSLVWPMNAKTDLPATLRQEMGSTAEEAMAKNFSVNWWTVGSNLEAETRRLDALMQEAR